MGNTRQKILRAMDVEVHETTMVSLLLFQSVFLGIFYGALDNAASALFLNVFPAEDLPMAFSVSGLAGIIMTTVYSFFQSKISFNKLSIFNASAIAITTFILWLGFNITTSKFHVFLVLVMMGPLNILALLGFWGTAGRVFNLRQGKRLFGLVDAGQIIGAILSCYAIPIILSFHIQTKEILLLSAVSVAIAAVLQIIISFKTDKLSQVEVKKAENAEQYSYKSLLKNKFVRLMSIFVALSMVSAFFISYSFLAVTKMKYPDITGLASFLGVFVGTVMFFTLMVKTFVYGKFMKTYGLRASLVISPLLLVILTVIASLVGIFGGYTASAGAFIFFFLLIAISRLFSVSLKSSIEAPSFKILYQTIESSIRYHVQAMVDGTINEFSALMSGLVLLGLSAISFFKLINFTEVLLIILSFWSIVAYKLYKAYKNNLNASLTMLKSDVVEVNKKGTTGIASKVLKGDEDANKVLFVMNLQEKIQPIVYEQLIPYLLNHRLNEVKTYALAKSSNLHLYEALDTLQNYHEEVLVNQSKELSKKLTAEIEKGFENEQILFLSRSKISSDRELAARLIALSGNTELTNHLKFLLRDVDNQVRIAAIKASAKLGNSELAPVLTEFLTSEVFGRYAFDALIAIGEKSLEFLEHTFNKAGNNTVLLTRIVRIIGNIGGDNACASLVLKLNYHDSAVAHLAANLLLSLGYKTDEANYIHIYQALQHTLAITAWNIAARASLHEANAVENMQNSIKDEIHLSYDHLFTLLSLLYDAQSIMHIRQNLESESAESTGYAIELLDLMVSDEIKPMLFPIIDDTSDNEKIRQLQVNFAIDIIPIDTLLIDIINRDYNYIGTWTKACALNIILQSETYTVTDNIVAQLFNPDEMLSGLAACIVNKFNPDSLPKYYKRLNEKTRIRLKNEIKLYTETPEKTIFTKVSFLKNLEYFKSISGNVLYQLANHLSIVNSAEGEEIECVDEDLNVMVYIVILGNIRNESNGNTIKEGEFVGGIFSPGYPRDFETYYAISNVSLYCCYQEIFDRIIFDYPELAETIINHIQTEKNIP